MWSQNIIMKKLKIWFVFLIQLAVVPPALAFKDNSITLGVGYYSQNSLNRISNNDSGSTGILGKLFTPLNLRYNYGFSSDWFVSGGLSYTLVPRAMPDSNGQVSFMHLTSLFGKNMYGSGNSVWDVYAGPGIMKYTIKGSGGIVTMSNGTGTANFAVPGGTSTVQKLTTNLGTSYSVDKSVFNFEMIIENLMSAKKRTQSLMFGYAYRFGSGY